MNSHISRSYLIYPDLSYSTIQGTIVVFEEASIEPYIYIANFSPRDIITYIAQTDLTLLSSEKNGRLQRYNSHQEIYKYVFGPEEFIYA